MRVEAECVACILSRAAAETREATSNPALRFRAMSELLRFLNKGFRPTSVPADLGTERDRIIRRVTGNSDPYQHSKIVSNRTALKLLPYAQKIVGEGYTQQDRFKRACLCAIVGNVMEFDIPGHRFSFSGMRKNFREAADDLVIDDLGRIFEIASKADTVLCLADNAGEIVFDMLLVEQLKMMGAKTIVAVKSCPVINDATLIDAEATGMDKLADKIITTGNDSVGYSPEEVSSEFREAYASADLILAKGMGYAETLTEHRLSKPCALLFRTKCNPVANYFATAREKNVAKLMV